jgi:hypothetical protein
MMRILTYIKDPENLFDDLSSKDKGFVNIHYLLECKTATRHSQ